MPAIKNDDAMLAAWGKYNYSYCADKGSHDMRLAFLAGYRTAAAEAASLPVQQAQPPMLNDLARKLSDLAEDIAGGERHFVVIDELLNISVALRTIAAAPSTPPASSPQEGK